MTADGMLLVRAAGRTVGIPLRDVLEVTAAGTVSPIPVALAAARGVMLARGRLVTVLHLGALLGGTRCPAAVPGATMVLVQVGEAAFALEVDEADTMPAAAMLPPPEGSEFASWSLGAIRLDRRWIPILNLDALTAPWRSREAGV